MKNNKEIQDSCQSLQTVVSVSVIESQLRVGNYIRDISSKIIGYIRNIKAKVSVKMPFSTLIQKSEYFEGIEITKESLLMFGIREIHINPKVVNEETESYFIIEITVLGNKFRVKSYYSLLYIHQLQNFYSEGTGLELQLVV